tara:strand:- start:3331 stop:3717 length:387 start_codon:yes stop_codon:yes gene_type:complete
MLQGKNPQTGLDVQEWGCSIAWIPLLLVENSRQTMQVQAATESFRNEMVDSNKAMAGLLKKSDTASNLLRNTTSIFNLLSKQQRAVMEGDTKLEDETIRQLSNNNIKIKKKLKKATTKKVKKNGNNSK